MMEIYFLGEDLSVIEGPIDEFTSVVWSERYNETGTFTLHFPRSLISRVTDAVYVRTSPSDNGGRILCGRIEYLTTSDSGDCEMGGHLLECLLDDRVMCGTGNYSGTVTEVVLEALSDNLRNDELLPIDVSPLSAEIGDNVTAVYSWDSLADWLYSLLSPYGASFRVELDSETMTPMFSLAVGRDLTSNSSEADQHAVFSSSFGNIISLEMEKNSKDKKNCAYVEGTDGTVVSLDKSDGGHKREIYKKATDISPDDFDSSEEYEAVLKKRADEILSGLEEAVYVSAECDSDALPKYGTDYFLGDICDVSDEELCLSFGMRLTAADTVCEGGVTTIYPSFGDEVRYIKKILKQ